ncbi:PilN domain-containing protein [Stenotrophomonas sp. W1S232]|uniref:PilN domain-containing protein n=1 Tax=Stenotrophomonas koreensis TaxID=266128 RepID=A0A7W3V1M4_9GAMM|nr:PilN domain-containing protein [Stenotrophomonas koreensis]MBB1117809.1 PilN domain-containing protein [Stenotrophomonas koreensis]
MARINLLPWRAERRKQRQRDFYGMLGAAAVGGVLLTGLIWFYYSNQITGQHARNDFLTQKIAEVKKQNEEIDRLDTQRDRLLARKAVIEELQAKRSQMVHLFDSLVRTIPDGVVLTGIKQEGDVLTLSGRTQSNARVSTYMRNLEGSGWMKSPELTIIEAKAQENAQGSAVVDVKALPYMFELKVNLPNPSSEEIDAQRLEEAGMVEETAAAAAQTVNDASDAAAEPAAVAPAPDKAAPAADAAQPAAAPATTGADS